MSYLYYSVLSSAFIFGAIIGSFLNVCIYRIPAGAVSLGSGLKDWKNMVCFFHVT
jgi:prepilin signal peptidase PulO-like enzyme (type II secretory pathway)